MVVYQRQFGPESYEAGTVYSNLGLLYSGAGNDPDQSLPFLLKARDIFQKKFGTHHFAVMVVHMNLGDAYLKKNDYNQALKHFQYSLSTASKLFGPAHFSVAYNCINLGEVCRTMGQYSQAIRYLNNALDVLNTVYPELSMVAGAYYNFGVSYLHSGEPEKGLEYLLRAFRLRAEILGPEHRDLAPYYFNLGDAYHQVGDPDKALQQFEKMVGLESAPGGNRKHIATAYMAMADANRSKGQFEKAIELLNKALALRTDIYGGQHPNIAYVLVNLAVNYWMLGDYNSADMYYAQALRALRYSDTNTLPEVSSIPALIHIMGHYGRFLLDVYTRRHDNGRLRDARQAFIELDRTIVYHHLHLENPGTRYLLAQQVLPLYETAIAAEIAFHGIAGDSASAHQAFAYAEKSKAMVLYKAMQEARALRFAGLPDEILEQEYQFRIDLAYFEKKRQVLLELGVPMADSVLAAIDVKLFDLNQQYQAFKNRLQFHYPAYYRLRYDLPVSSVQQVQNDLLQPNQTLLEYFVGDTSIFLFVVGKHLFHVEQIKKDFPLEEWVKQFRNLLTENRSTGAAQYADLAHRLYQKLIQPVKNRLREELVIVPDGVLGYLPFEALLSRKPEKPLRFQHHAYLLNEHRISYCYSACSPWRPISPAIPACSPGCPDTAIPAWPSNRCGIAAKRCTAFKKSSAAKCCTAPGLPRTSS